MSSGSAALAGSAVRTGALGRHTPAVAGPGSCHRRSVSPPLLPFADPTARGPAREKRLVPMGVLPTVRLVASRSVRVRILPSALRQGIAERDALHAYRNAISSRPLDDGRVMLVGPGMTRSSARSASGTMPMAMPI